MQRRRPTTGTLTTIGDLPVDLRAGVRRRLWHYALAGIGVAAAIAITMRGTAHEVPSSVDATTTTAAAIPYDATTRPDRVDTSTSASNRPDPSTARPNRVDPSTTRPNPVDPSSSAGAPGTGASTRARGDARPAGVESLRDEPCDPPTCALHGNERECCAPFRATALPEALDRTMVAAAIGPVKPAIIACATASTSSGAIRIAVDVGGDGRVVHAVVDEAPEAGVAQCIAAALRTARFAPTRDGGTFRYHYELP